MNVSEYFFSQDEPQIPSPQVVTICSWRNCVCCFQDVATPISICQQSYFSYAISIYHRRKPLNSKFSINPKTQACFLFLGTKEQIPRSSIFGLFISIFVQIGQFHPIPFFFHFIPLWPFTTPHWIFKIIFFISKIKSQEYHIDIEYLMSIGQICLAVSSK